MSTQLKRKDAPDGGPKPLRDLTPWHAAWMLALFVILVLSIVLLTSNTRAESTPCRAGHLSKIGDPRMDSHPASSAAFSHLESSERDMLSDTIPRQLNFGRAFGRGQLLEQQLGPKGSPAGNKTAEPLNAR